MNKTRALGPLLASGFATLAAISGCRMSYLDIGADKAALGTGSGGASSTMMGGTGGSSTMSSSSSGTGGGLPCTPGATAPCYSGPPGTAGVGICTAGMQTCAANGMSWGPCVGEVLPQPENCATPADDDCDGTAPGCTGALKWPLTFGDAADQYLMGVAVDGAGNVLLTGYFAGTVNFGGGPLTSAGTLDAFVVKLDKSGNHVWSKRFGTTGASEAMAIAVDGAGNVIVTGELTGSVNFGGGALASAGGHDVFILKLDPSGNHVWSRRYGDAAGQFVTGLAADASGNVLVTGDFSGAIDFGGGPLTTPDLDVFAAKLDQSGNLVWSRRFGDTAGQDGGGVAFDSKGNVILTGHYSGTVDLGGGALPSGGGGDVFVAKFDAAGGYVWAKHFGGTPKGVAVDNADEVVVTGVFSGSVDFGGGALTSAGGLDVFAVKLDSGGGHLWSKRFGDAGSQSSAGVAVDATGNVVLTGSFSGSIDLGGGALASAGGMDGFLAKLDPSGAQVWSKRLGNAPGSASDQSGKAVAVDTTSNVFVGGNFSGSVDLGSGLLPSAGGSDIFVAMFAP